MLKLLSPMVLVYITSIIVVNFLFAHVPLVDTGFGMLSPVALLVGLTFVFRDFAQRQAEHWVLAAMGIGLAISYLMADPYVATASALAFAVSEGVDWVLYTITKKPFSQRVLISSLVATPLDTFIFLYWIDALTPGTVVLMILSKMLAAGVIWWRKIGDKGYSYV